MTRPPGFTVVLALSMLPAMAVLVFPAGTSAQTNVTVTNTIPITFSGEVRARSEWDKPGGSLQADEFTYLRTRFGIKVDATSYAHLMVQVQDSRVLGGEGNPLTTASTLFDLHQAYAELSAPWHNVQYAVRAGRQEMPLRERKTCWRIELDQHRSLI